MHRPHYEVFQTPIPHYPMHAHHQKAFHNRTRPNVSNEVCVRSGSYGLHHLKSTSYNASLSCSAYTIISICLSIGPPLAHQLHKPRERVDMQRQILHHAQWRRFWQATPFLCIPMHEFFHTIVQRGLH